MRIISLRDFLRQRYNTNHRYIYYKSHSHLDAVSGKNGGNKSARIIDYLASSDFELTGLSSLESDDVKIFDHFTSIKRRVISLNVYRLNIICHNFQATKLERH